MNRESAFSMDNYSFTDAERNKNGFSSIINPKKIDIATIYIDKILYTTKNVAESKYTIQESQYTSFISFSTSIDNEGLNDSNSLSQTISVKCPPKTIYPRFTNFLNKSHKNIYNRNIIFHMGKIRTSTCMINCLKILSDLKTVNFQASKTTSISSLFQNQTNYKFLPPERLLNNTNSKSIDAFAFGGILYHMLTNSHKNTFSNCIIKDPCKQNTVFSYKIKQPIEKILPKKPPDRPNIAKIIKKLFFDSKSNSDTEKVEDDTNSDSKSNANASTYIKAIDKVKQLIKKFWFIGRNEQKVNKKSVDKTNSLENDKKKSKISETVRFLKAHVYSISTNEQHLQNDFYVTKKILEKRVNDEEHCDDKISIMNASLKVISDIINYYNSREDNSNCTTDTDDADAGGDTDELNKTEVIVPEIVEFLLESNEAENASSNLSPALFLALGILGISFGAVTVGATIAVGVGATISIGIMINMIRNFMKRNINQNNSEQFWSQLLSSTYENYMKEKSSKYTEDKIFTLIKSAYEIISDHKDKVIIDRNGSKSYKYDDIISEYLACQVISGKRVFLDLFSSYLDYEIDLADVALKCGKILTSGKDVPIDNEMGARFFRIGADLGSPDAMYQYAYMKYNGIGVKQDKEIALEYYKKSLSGRMVYIGNGLNIYIYRESSTSYNLATDINKQRPIFGFGYEVSTGKSSPHYRAFVGNNKGIIIGGDIKVIIEEKTKYYKMPSDKGQVDSMDSIAHMLINCYGVKIDKKEASKYYKMAADKGQIEAMFNNALILSNGDGVKINKKEAAKYIKMAADRGQIEAMFSYAVALYKGEGIEIKKNDSITKQKVKNNQLNDEALFNLILMLLNVEGTKSDKKKTGWSIKNESDEEDSGSTCSCIDS